ncbi:MAG: hypothetical protein OXI34_00340 [Chloroflexota bacterium]|nr:hypothetical protein [Chloroflexota bacterium]MDE2946543.1 hypothetical protein [Chloroflexota bacterium]
MKSAGAKFFILLMFAALAAQTGGQGAPAQIDAALRDLSGRLGYSVGIGSLSNWRWEQVNFPNSALGCPGVSGSGAAVLGYQFQLTYNANTYDYRVSNDGARLVYCGLIDAAGAAAAPEAEAPYSNRLCSDAATGGPYMRSRINAGLEVEALAGSLNLRGHPSLEAPVLLDIPARLPLRITAGPDCVDGYVWWLAIFNDQTGYIAEAGDGDYYVQPLAPPAIPSRETLNINLVAYLQEFGRLHGNFQPAHDWSSDNRYLAMPGAIGSDSVWLYDLRQPSLTPVLLEFDQGISTLAFRPDQAQFAFGSDAGSLHLWQIVDGAPATFSERLYLNAHEGPVSAIAFSPDGEKFASAGPEANTQADVDRRFAAIVWDLPTVAQESVLTGNGELIHKLAFSPNGDSIFSAGDNSRGVWAVSSGERFGSFGLSAVLTAVEYSPAGQQFAWAQAAPGASLEILDPVSFASLASYPVPTSNVTSLGFSPDGAMLAVGAAEGVFSVWDTKAHQLLTTRETDGAIHDISFSPDGSLIAVSTAKRSLHLYGVPLGSG